MPLRLITLMGLVSAFSFAMILFIIYGALVMNAVIPAGLRQLFLYIFLVAFNYSQLAYLASMLPKYILKQNNDQNILLKPPYD